MQLVLWWGCRSSLEVYRRFGGKDLAIDSVRLEKVRRQTHPLRHLPSRKRSPDPAAAGISRCFRGLCGSGWALASSPGGPKAVSRGRYSLDLMTARGSVKPIKTLIMRGFDLKIIRNRCGSCIHAAGNWHRTP